MKPARLIQTLFIPLTIFLSLALVTLLLVFVVPMANDVETAQAPSDVPSSNAPTIKAQDKGTPPPPAVDLTPRWTFDVGGNSLYPPVVAQGRVFTVSQADVIYALDINSGEILWRFAPGEGHVWNASLAAGPGVLYAGLEGGWLVALDAVTGAKIWERQVHGEPYFHPFVTDGALYLATSFVGGRMKIDHESKARVYALRPEDGSVIWESPTDNFGLRSPILHNGTLYVGGGFKSDRPTPGNEGGWTRFYALDAASGETNWVWENPDGFPKSIMATDQTLAYVAYSDVVRSLDAATGEEKWWYHTENNTHGFLGAGNRIYFGSANAFIHALDADSGEVLWKYDQYGVFNYVVGHPALMDGTLYYQTTFNEIWALDAETGEVLWWGPSGYSAQGAIGAAEGTLLLTSVDGILYAYDAKQ